MDRPENPQTGKRQHDPDAVPAIPAIDEARLEKIARIKKAVEDGTYHVSSDDIASKLIEHMLNPKS